MRRFINQYWFLRGIMGAGNDIPRDKYKKYKTRKYTDDSILNDYSSSKIWYDRREIVEMYKTQLESNQIQITIEDYIELQSIAYDDNDHRIRKLAKEIIEKYAPNPDKKIPHELTLSITGTQISELEQKLEQTIRYYDLTHLNSPKTNPKYEILYSKKGNPEGPKLHTSGNSYEEAQAQFKEFGVNETEYEQTIRISIQV